MTEPIGTIKVLDDAVYVDGALLVDLGDLEMDIITTLQAEIDALEAKVTRLHDAGMDASAAKVDWRERALAAERERDEARAEAERLRADGWIPVDERLPEEDELVEVYLPDEPSTRDEMVTCGHRDKYGWTYMIALKYPGSEGRPWFGATVDGVTHWRPLSPPPDSHS